MYLVYIRPNNMYICPIDHNSYFINCFVFIYFFRHCFKIHEQNNANKKYINTFMYIFYHLF